LVVLTLAAVSSTSAAHALQSSTVVGVTELEGRPAVVYVPCPSSDPLRTVQVIDVGSNGFLGGDDDEVLWQLTAGTGGARFPRSEPVTFVVGQEHEGLTQSVPASRPPGPPAALVAVIDDGVEAYTDFTLDDLDEGEVFSQEETFPSVADFADHVARDCDGQRGVLLSSYRLERGLILAVVGLAVVVAATIGLVAVLARRRPNPS
jgi:hypothetical protein